MDITRCKGNKCPVKIECKRYMAIELTDNYFTDEPFEITDNKFTCKMYRSNQIDIETVIF